MKVYAEVWSSDLCATCVARGEEVETFDSEFGYPWNRVLHMRSARPFGTPGNLKRLVAQAHAVGWRFSGLHEAVIDPERMIDSGFLSLDGESTLQTRCSLCDRKRNAIRMEFVFHNISQSRLDRLAKKARVLLNKTQVAPENIPATKGGI